MEGNKDTIIMTTYSIIKLHQTNTLGYIFYVKIKEVHDAIN